MRQPQDPLLSSDYRAINEEEIEAAQIKGDYLQSAKFSTEDRKRKFVEEILLSIKDIDSSLSDVGLLFVPVVRSFHIFLFVFDLRQPAFMILDNIKRDDTSEDRYSSLPSVFFEYFVEYLSSVQHSKAQDFQAFVLFLFLYILNHDGRALIITDY
ncbi:hypothetical protein L2E82_44764 [Cichorium intybus]|uniref:Uncharacterized protein n=1 Tax=Cichorium intybus TaxID=13427 RepID=A0ACB8ZR07_CICIN|nr:hypothetical protein L2E82_44764 [Cichorium intybus]